jgi:hypothetical protein
MREAAAREAAAARGGGPVRRRHRLETSALASEPLRWAHHRAEVAELADARVSNTLGRKVVRVQIPASAPPFHARDRLCDWPPQRLTMWRTPLVQAEGPLVAVDSARDRIHHEPTEARDKVTRARPVELAFAYSVRRRTHPDDVRW